MIPVKELEEALELLRCRLSYNPETQEFLCYSNINNECKMKWLQYEEVALAIDKYGVQQTAIIIAGYLI